MIFDSAWASIAALGLAEAALAADGAALGATLLAAALRAASAFAVFWLVARLYRWRTGAHGLGFGDVKLAAASAIWLSTGQQIAALEVACLAAIALVLVRGAQGAAIPFGAFLAPAAWLAFVLAGPAEALLARFA